MKSSTHNIKAAQTAMAAIGALALVLFAALPSKLLAADPARVNAERPMLDPWLPPASRNADASLPTQGTALQAQVERKLQERFAAADKRGAGVLTREQARAAGLGFVVNHFEQIDQRRTGAVRFDDIKRFLRERGAQLN